MVHERAGKLSFGDRYLFHISWYCPCAGFMHVVDPDMELARLRPMEQWNGVYSWCRLEVC